MEVADRFVAAPRVKRDQHIAVRPGVRLIQDDFMAKLAQDAQPPGSRNFVAVVKTQGCWRDELYVHVV